MRKITKCHRGSTLKFSPPHNPPPSIPDPDLSRCLLTPAPFSKCQKIMCTKGPFLESPDNFRARKAILWAQGLSASFNSCWFWGVRSKIVRWRNTSSCFAVKKINTTSLKILILKYSSGSETLPGHSRNGPQVRMKVVLFVEPYLARFPCQCLNTCIGAKVTCENSGRNWRRSKPNFTLEKPVTDSYFFLNWTSQCKIIKTFLQEALSFGF